VYAPLQRDGHFPDAHCRAGPGAALDPESFEPSTLAALDGVVATLPRRAREFRPRAPRPSGQLSYAERQVRAAKLGQRVRSSLNSPQAGCVASCLDRHSWLQFQGSGFNSKHVFVVQKLFTTPTCAQEAARQEDVAHMAALIEASKAACHGASSVYPLGEHVACRAAGDKDFHCTAAGGCPVQGSMGSRLESAGQRIRHSAGEKKNRKGNYWGGQLLCALNRWVAPGDK
jgi:hypothetical protein